MYQSVNPGIIRKNEYSQFLVDFNENCLKGIANSVLNMPCLILTIR
jgi:hypothetical protein